MITDKILLGALVQLNGELGGKLLSDWGDMGSEQVLFSDNGYVDLYRLAEIINERQGWEGKSYQAHRLSYINTNGEITNDKLKVCHHCDNPSCVNPAHLFLGTQNDNMQDKMKKGRHVSTRGRSNSGLLNEQTAAIRLDPRDSRVIAAEYDISRNYVYSIKNGNARVGK